MTESGLGDLEARQAIEEDLDTTILVEAAAGTGKTTSLVQRMVALLREDRVSVDRMATMTFTRKAAAHLRETFQLALEQALRMEMDVERGARLANALSRMDRCFVGTIHSFCARMLRERPLEAGVDPDFVELEENDDRQLRATCWEAYTEQLFVENSPVLHQLEVLGVNLADLQATYMMMSDYPEVTLVSSEVPRPDLTHARERIARFLDSVQGEIPDVPPEKGWDDLQTRLRRAFRLRQVLDLTVEADLVRLLETFDHAGNVTKQRWPDAHGASRVKREFDELRVTIVHPALCQWREYLHPILLNVIRPAIAALQSRRLSSGQLNFQDLLIVARDLLCQNGTVRGYLQRRFTHLLVDEFQDTDPIQAEVLLYLTSEDVDESDWRKLHPRPGALFVVGDPKQSIYRFRRADTATYNQVREIIVSKGGRVLELTTNFRSVGTICAWINTVFDDVFPNSSTREQAANARLEAHRLSGDARCGVFKLETKSGSRRRADLVAQEDADKIAQWIRWALDSRWQILTENEAGAVGSRDPKPADFLIIARNRLRLHTYAKALESRGIPYEISGGRALADSEELAALFPVFRAVADPDDPVALVSFLRGELWGVDDNALFRFRRAGGRFSYLSAPPKDVDERIVEGFEFLQEARRWARHLPPGTAMARIFERLGIIAYSASQNLGDTRSGNLLKTLTLARTLSAQGRSFTDIIDHLLQVVNDREMEGMTVEPGRTNAVRLMNLHRAKGLEAPVVFLADPNTPIVHSPLFTINRDTEKPEGHTLIVANEGFHRRELARPRGWDERAANETAFHEAEEDRLLYVASTRAEQMLVVSVNTKESKRTNARRIAGPWIRFLEAIDQDLHLPGFSTPTMSLAAPEKPPEKFRALRGEMERNYAVVRQASYGVTQVTTVSDCDADRVPAQEGREDGAAWGRVLHRLLETTIRDPERDMASQARFHLREEGLPLEALEEVLREVDGVRTSDLWQRGCRAERRLVEVPFALTIPSVDLDIKHGPPETILKGVIDLAFSEGTEWIIVDYKSDRVRSSHSHLIARYAPQVRQYRRHWEELTGERTRAALLFTETGHAHWVD